jgi:predicted transcriptional regulator
MTKATEAYQHWQKTMKVSMQVHSDQQLFEIGFNAAQTIMTEMEKVIAEMERDTQKLKAEIKKLRKPQP